jgi:hypothetical protein
MAPSWCFLCHAYSGENNTFIMKLYQYEINAAPQYQLKASTSTRGATQLCGAPSRALAARELDLDVWNLAVSATKTNA